MKFVKDYMEDDTLRHALNELTQATFGFDFEDWVTKGYYEGDYIPYSYMENNRIIANVSVNRMNFFQNGQEKYYIQIGTVMTDKDFRKKGHARELIEKVLLDYTGKCDGIYLFGNLSALEFYDKLGFLRGMQYQYILKSDVIAVLQKKARELEEDACFQLINSADQMHKSKYMKMVKDAAINAALEQKNKFGLQMFYTAEMEHVYYSKKLDCYVVMEWKARTLHLQSIICSKRVRIEQVLTHIIAEYDRMLLGFAPCTDDTYLFDLKNYNGEEDYRLFYHGEELEHIATEKLYFPEFSHA